MKSDTLNHYYAHGKLLISGEYLVLRGATALVVPLKPGQHMQVEVLPSQGISSIEWKAGILGKAWFSAQIMMPNFRIIKTTDIGVAGRLINILQTAAKMNPSLFSAGKNYIISTNSEFDHSWGFGSSASLLANVSQMASIDPFHLSSSLSSGSGCDVAAAISTGPVFFTNPGKIEPVNFFPSCHHKIWFAWTGRKQDSAREVADFENLKVRDQDIEQMNSLSVRFIHSSDIYQFMQVMHEHEELISRILQKPPVRKEMFPDFPGAIKSLGAWGGDFIMAASDEPEEAVLNNLRANNIVQVFRFQELILS